MIKARGTKEDGTPLYIFGLSTMNIQKLREGKPIHFSLTDLDGEGDVCILFGETEKAIAEQLDDFIGPSTRITPST